MCVAAVEMVAPLRVHGYLTTVPFAQAEGAAFRTAPTFTAAVCGICAGTQKEGSVADGLLLAAGFEGCQPRLDLGLLPEVFQGGELCVEG